MIVPPAATPATPHDDEMRGEIGLLREIRDTFRQFILAAFDPYRPEEHYMRGPGPACRARHDGAS